MVSFLLVASRGRVWLINKWPVSVIHDTYSYFNEIYSKSMLKMKQLTLMFYVQFKFPSHKKQKKMPKSYAFHRINIIQVQEALQITTNMKQKSI